MFRLHVWVLFFACILAQLFIFSCLPSFFCLDFASLYLASAILFAMFFLFVGVAFGALPTLDFVFSFLFATLFASIFNPRLSSDSSLCPRLFLFLLLFLLLSPFLYAA